MTEVDRLDPVNVPADTPVGRPGLLSGWRERRRLQRARLAEEDVRHDDVRAKDHVWREAYERGRHDERRRRRGSPLLSFLLMLIAVAGGALIYLAAREGSFAAGGQVIDNTLGNAASNVNNKVQPAADRAGNALEGAGQTLKQVAGSGR